ncbi:SIR2 family protein [Paraburkholderia sediminicola]|uniref:SIR2 family protein n=1 Tax=Paraburkholderia sediminicola TaxID=458836 RepID=UPI0038B7373C
MVRAIAQNDPDLAPPLDQVFGLLQREYSRSRVEREVNRELKNPIGANPVNHEAVLRLSVDASGSPFIVTTNFDLMFERANRQLQQWTPPLLPSMTTGEAPTGIVYLHGRLQHQRDDGQNLVLGSGDFGRAYLADGWATVFMRELLEQRVVVLLGYSASDPPIRYLLEGLSASNSPRLRTIYAFDRGEPDEVRAKWHELGIVGIAFHQFTDLWATLEAWASRAADKDSWTSSVISYAQMSPRKLLPYQRGQVVALVETQDGARAFADAEPPPVAEWLCVFDRLSRYRPPEKNGWGSDVEEIDPHVEYGLDDDPPRPPLNENGRSTDIGAKDLIGSLPTDEDGRSYMRLAGMRSVSSKIDSKRLWWFVRWFERVAEQPAAVWWVARQNNLHPAVLDAVDRRLNGRSPGILPLKGEARRVWALLAESFAELPDDIGEFAWYTLVERIRIEGWSSSVLRKFAKIAQPRLAIGKSMLRAPVPPSIDESAEVGNLVQFEVTTAQRHGVDINVPDNMVRPVFQIIRQALVNSIGLLSETVRKSRFFRLPAIEPDSRPGVRIHHREGIEADFFWAVELFERLCKLSPSDAREELGAWPKSDDFIFDKLKLHFWRNDSVFDGENVGVGILDLSDDTFWNTYLRRELLILLRSRWTDLRTSVRRSIERRIIQGPQPYEGESPDDFASRITYSAGTSLGWLEQNGCTLSQSALKFLKATRKKPDWSGEAEATADHDYDGRSGWIARKTDPQNLMQLPISEIVARALELSKHDRFEFVEHAPFAGLVRERPARALRALSSRANGEVRAPFLWRQLLSNWPDSTSKRTLLVCACKIADAPDDLFFELRFDISGWFEKHLPSIFLQKPDLFWSVWDKIFQRIVVIGENATESALHEDRNKNATKSFSRSIDFAINAPVGHMVEAAFAILTKTNYERDEGLDPALLDRLDRTLTAPGDGARHAATLIGRRLNFLYHVDGRWVKNRLAPFFSRQNALSDAIWAGVLWSEQVPHPGTLFRLLKVDFLKLFSEPYGPASDAGLENNAARMLIVARFWRLEDRRYVTNEECRRILQTIGESGRHAALWMVGQIIEEHSVWERFGKPFFSSVWPQEVVFQTSTSTDAIIRIANQLPDIFDKVTDAVKDYLTSIEHADVALYGLQETKGDNLSLAMRWPKHVLFMLDKIVETTPNYPPLGLQGLLDEIAMAAPTLRTTKSWRRLHDIVSR